MELPSNSSCQRYGDSLELLAMSLVLLVISLELLATSLELLAVSLEELVGSLELLASPDVSLDEEDSIAGTSTEDEVGGGSVIGFSLADDKGVSLEGVVCSLISSFSALDEESEEQAAKKTAVLAHRTKCLKFKENMAKFL